MRTAGLTMNDVWAGRVLRERGVETYRLDKQDAEIGVLVDSVELKHRGKDENYRPYLHLTGELRSITPARELPYGISEVTYGNGLGEKVDAFYEFDDEQLVALGRKGYFNPSFRVPEQITGVEWELPATVDVLVLVPGGQEQDAPVVFTQVHDIASLEVDLTSSGYDLTDYFDDYSKDGVERAEAQVDERGLRARGDAIDALFSESELDLVQQAERASAPAPQEEQSEADSVDSAVKALEEQVAAERAAYEAERARTAGTTENLYHERVASTMPSEPDETSAAVEPEAAAVPVAEDLDLDLEYVDDEVPALDAQVQGVDSTSVGPRRAVQPGDFDFDRDDEDHGLGS